MDNDALAFALLARHTPRLEEGVVAVDPPEDGCFEHLILAAARHLARHANTSVRVRFGVLVADDSDTVMRLFAQQRSKDDASIDLSALCEPKTRELSLPDYKLEI